MIKPLLTLALCACVVACGGGSSPPDPATSAEPTTPSPTATPGTPSPTPTPTLPSSVPTPSYAVGSAELGGWNTLQTARVLCGFGALRQDTRLDAAALAHARYLTTASMTSGESLLSHYETDRSNRYYTGYYPWDRSAAQDYGDQVAEILEATVWQFDARDPPIFPDLQTRGANSMLSLMNTVYHLMGAMYEGADIGFGADLQIAANGDNRREEFRFGALNGYESQRLQLGSGKLATYPCEGSQNIPNYFVPANESPNPFPAMIDPSQTVGPPIYLKVDAGQVLRVSASSIGNSAGQVPTTVLTHATDPQREIGTHETFVVPDRALLPNTTYQVSLGGSIDGKPFTRSFTLRTGP